MTAHCAQGLDMPFPDRLVPLRKAQNLTQQALADRAGMSAIQVRRYEGGKTQPNMDALKRLAIALSVSADILIFDDDERSPQNDRLRLQFEAISRFNDDDQKVALSLIDTFIKKHQMEEVLEHRPTAKKPSHSAGLLHYRSSSNGLPRLAK